MSIQKTDTGFTLTMTDAEANVLVSLLAEVGGDAENDFLFTTFEILRHHGVPGDRTVEVESNAEQQAFDEDWSSLSHRLVVT